MTKILYVEDREPWRRMVGRALEKAGFEVVLFDNVKKAKLYAAKNEVNLFLCDGAVNEGDDGLRWAKELHDAGQKVITLSTNEAEGVPSHSKGEFNLGQELIAKIHALIG